MCILHLRLCRLFYDNLLRSALRCPHGCISNVRMHVCVGHRGREWLDYVNAIAPTSAVCMGE